MMNQEGVLAEDRAMAGIVRERTGLAIESIYDLVNTRQRYPEAISVLVELLPQASDPRVREGILRALMTADAIGIANDALFVELRRTEGSYFRWVIAYVLSRIVRKADVPELLRWLDAEPDPGTRAMLVETIGKARDPAAVPALVRLLDDNVSARAAARALASVGVFPGDDGIAKLRRLEAEGDVRQKKSATRALARLDGGRR